MKNLQLFDILTSPVCTVAPESLVQDALLLMREKRISSLVVTDEQQRPVGIFTERDAVLLAYQNASPETASVYEVMGKPPLTALSDMDYRKGYELISKRGLRHLIVVDDTGILAGIVTIDNFLEHLNNEFLVRFKEVGAVMNRKVVTLPSDATVDDAVRLMALERISCVVVEDQAQPSGIFTERDIVRLNMSPEQASLTTLVEVMSSPARTVNITKLLPDAINEMSKAGIRRLVVVDAHNTIVGLVTHHDIVNQLYDRHMEHLRETLLQREQELKEVRGKLQAQHQLQRSEERLAESQRMAHIGSWEIDKANGKYWWSNEVFNIFGVDPKSFDVSFEGFLDIVHPDDREFVVHSYSHSEANHSTYNIVHRLLLSDQKIKYVNERCEHHYDAAGNILYSVGTVQDITEQKTIEFALKESEQRFRSIFEQAATGVALIDTKTSRFLRINKYYCEMLGYSIDEMSSGKTFEEITHPDDLQADLDNMSKLISGEIREFSMEKRYFHQNGDIVWAELTVSPMWDIGEEPHLHIAVVQNITDRKEANDEILRQRKQLMNAEHIGHMGNWELDVDTLEAKWSPEMYSIFGIPQSTKVGPAFLETVVHSDDWQKLGHL